MFRIPASAGMTTVIYYQVKRYIYEMDFSTLPEIR